MQVTTQRCVAPDGENGGSAAPSRRRAGGQASSANAPVDAQDAASVDDGYLVARAVEGYVDAFEMLVARHTGAVYRTALRVVGDPGDAQDITQDTFLAAWQNLARFRGDSAFSTWLYQIVTRRALNHVTRGRTRHATDLASNADAAPAGSRAVRTGGQTWDPRDDPHRDPRHDDPAIAARPAVDAVTAAVLQLPPPQRAAIVLHYFERLSYAEIATVTGNSVPAVRSHLFRARTALARSLQTWR